MVLPALVQGQRKHKDAMRQGFTHLRNKNPQVLASGHPAILVHTLFHLAHSTEALVSLVGVCFSLQVERPWRAVALTWPSRDLQNPAEDSMNTS